MRTKKTVTMGLLTAVALMLSYAEAQLPSLGIPGVKMGLANIAVIFALQRLGPKEAVMISSVRIALVTMLFSSVSAMFYSLAGAALSILGMIALKKTGLFSAPAVSAAGGALHNLGQIALAMVILDTKAFVYYLPVLVFTGTVSGIFTGLCAARLLKIIPDKMI